MGHGGSVTLPETLFSGLNDSQKPAFVRITAIDAKPAGTDSAGVMSTTVNGEKLPVKVGDLIPADQFDGTPAATRGAPSPSKRWMPRNSPSPG